MLIIKKVWIDGTEELAPKSYQNYRYYFGTIPKGYAYCRFYGGIHRIFVDIMPRMENDNYADKYTEVNDILNEAVKNYKVPGISVMVVDSEGILFLIIMESVNLHRLHLLSEHLASLLQHHAS